MVCLSVCWQAQPGDASRLLSLSNKNVCNYSSKTMLCKKMFSFYLSATYPTVRASSLSVHQLFLSVTKQQRTRQGARIFFQKDSGALITGAEECHQKAAGNLCH